MENTHKGTAPLLRKTKSVPELGSSSSSDNEYGGGNDTGKPSIKLGGVIYVMEEQGVSGDDVEEDVSSGGKKEKSNDNNAGVGGGDNVVQLLDETGMDDYFNAFVDALFNQAKIVFDFTQLSKTEMAKFLVNCGARVAVAGVISYYTAILFVKTGEKSGTYITIEWNSSLPPEAAQITFITGGAPTNVVLNDEGGIDALQAGIDGVVDLATKANKEKVTELLREQVKTPEDFAQLKKLAEQELYYDGKYKKCTASKIGKLSATLVFSCAAATVYGVLSLSGGSSTETAFFTWLTNIPPLYLGIMNIFSSKSHPAYRQAILDYAKRQRNELVNIYAQDPPKALRIMAQAAQTSDQAYFLLALTNENRDETITYLPPAEISTYRKLFKSVILSISIGGILGYVGDVVTGVLPLFSSLPGKITLGTLAFVTAIIPFVGLSRSAGTSIGSNLFSDQETLASIVYTKLLKGPRIAAGYLVGTLLAAVSGGTNYMVNTQTMYVVMGIFGALQNLATKILANAYGAVGLISAPITNFFYWLLMVDHLTVWAVKHMGFLTKDDNLRKFIQFIEAIDKAYEVLNSMPQAKYDQLMKDWMKAIHENEEPDNLTKQLFAILNEELDSNEKTIFSKKTDINLQEYDRKEVFHQYHRQTHTKDLGRAGAADVRISMDDGSQAEHQPRSVTWCETLSPARLLCCCGIRRKPGYTSVEETKTVDRNAPNTYGV